MPNVSSSNPQGATRSLVSVDGHEFDLLAYLENALVVGCAVILVALLLDFDRHQFPLVGLLATTPIVVVIARSRLSYFVRSQVSLMLLALSAVAGIALFGPTLGAGIGLGLLSVVAAAVSGQRSAIRWTVASAVGVLLVGVAVSRGWWAVKPPPAPDDLLAGVRMTLVAATVLCAVAWGHRRVVGAIHAMEEHRQRALLEEVEETFLQKQLRDSADDLTDGDEVGQRAGGIAHDVNNTLVAVVANVEILEELVPPTDRDVVARLARAADAARYRAQRILAVGRPRLPADAACDGKVLVTSFARFIEQTLGTRVHVSVPARPTHVAMSPAALQRLLLALVMETLDATNAPGSLSFTLSPILEGPYAGGARLVLRQELHEVQPEPVALRRLRMQRFEGLCEVVSRYGGELRYRESGRGREVVLDQGRPHEPSFNAPRVSLPGPAPTAHGAPEEDPAPTWADEPAAPRMPLTQLIRTVAGFSLFGLAPAALIVAIQEAYSGGSVPLLVLTAAVQVLLVVGIGFTFRGRPKALCLVLVSHAMATAVLLTLRYGSTIGLGSLWLGIVLVSATVLKRRMTWLVLLLAMLGVASIVLLGQCGWEPTAGHAMRDTSRFSNWVRYTVVALMTGVTLSWVTSATYVQLVQSSSDFESALRRHAAARERRAEVERVLERMQRSDALAVLAHKHAEQLSVALRELIEAARALLGSSRDEEVDEMIDEVIEAATSGLEITLQLSEWGAAPRSGRCRACDALEGVFRNLQARRPPGLRLTRSCETQADVPMPEHDVERILVNLGVNAFHATGEGGHVAFRVRDLDGADGVCIEVEDDGAGMSPETLSRVFEPFFSTKGEGGTGLGLPTVERLVRAAGGRVVVDSVLGTGTTVRLELPSGGYAFPTSRLERRAALS